MCGIHCHVSASAHASLKSQDAEFLMRRGPDAFSTHRCTASADGHEWYLTFASSVLSLRGDVVQPQPLIDDATGSVFCWNGEAWSYHDSKISGNDTQIISKYLFDAVHSTSSATDSVIAILNQIVGPHAFVFWDAKSSVLYFGRDALGRRSLIIHSNKTNSGELTISSVNIEIGDKALEVEVPFIYCVDLTKPELNIRALPSGQYSPSVNELLPTEFKMIQTTPSSQAVSNVIDQLKFALRLRVEAIPTYTAHGQRVLPSRLGILFSGGLDCTLLARLTHELLPFDQPIDLLNVAFENPRVLNARAAGKQNTGSNTGCDSYESCPDRITGRSSFSELTRVCSQRTWRFVAINVPYKEFIDHRATIIRLMYPHNTEMDLSITSALYFAARGQGSIESEGGAMELTELYTTTARVLLSGLGADELFGGYARHAAAFTRGGFDALNYELELDFSRIGKRNLGRDDRVIAHWGRETRYPFLDENFVKYALGLPAWEKCGFRTGKTIPKHFETSIPPTCMEDLHPEKMLLRCAMWQLGMYGAAAEKKRAIQFGARTAKMYGGRTKGTDVVVPVQSISDET